MANNSISKKLMDVISRFSKTDIDAEIRKTQAELKRLTALRELLYGREDGSVTVGGSDDVGDEDDDEIEPTAVISPQDKEVLRRKVVTLLKGYGQKRYDILAQNIEVTKDVMKDLLNHPWFSTANSVGGYMLTGDGHVEANRIAGR